MMKYLHLLSAAILVTAASFSFNAISADGVVTESPSVEMLEPHNQVASFNSILEFEEAAKSGQTVNAYQSCNATVYTRYTSIRLNDTRTIASFTHDGGDCNRYGFAIIRNYEGHDFKVTLLDSQGNRVAGGYSVAVSTSIFDAGTYYWEVTNKTTTGSTYGGMTYEVRSKG
ncbi:hypothetical protein [Thalassomonas haliotis]|uniref:Uncharacterized protein n=1 Tax=Thalassomonas haliotis TaxID=485448 RepID=A0ABY7V9I7_9GAMM|nr:hypothetical protein [Thalassomonas haliotis]WDE10012.1 hypothetical protein H3N35_17100 [Thalassomonas haliotis]